MVHGSKGTFDTVMITLKKCRYLHGMEIMMKKKLVMLCLSMSMVFAMGCAKDGNKNDVFETENHGSTTEESIVESKESVVEIKESEETKTTDETEDVSSVEDEMFSAFLNDELTVTVGEDVAIGYNDYQISHVGEELTLSELEEAMLEDEIFEDITPSLSYTYVQKGEETVLVLKFENVGIEPSDDYSYFVIAKDGDDLKLTYNDNGWSRCDTSVNAAGVFMSSGSSAAGDHGSNVGFIGEDGTYQSIYEARYCYSGWFGSMFEYYSVDMFSEETIELAYAVNDSDYEEEIALYQLGDKVYGIFPGEDNADVTALQEAAAKDGLLVVSGNEITGIIQEYAESLGVSQEDLEAYDCDWVQVK